MKSKNFIKKIKIEELTSKLKSKEFENIKLILQKENADSLLSRVSNNILKEYLNYCSLSSSFFLYTCSIKKNIIGYAIFASNYKLQQNEFLFLSIKIIFDQICKFNFFSLINFFLIFTNIENLLINKNKSKLVNSNLNLNLLAIKKKYQSKGIGKFFIKICLKKILNRKKYKYLITETYNQQSLSFYLNKLNFKILGLKLRCFKILKILIFRFKT